MCGIGGIILLAGKRTGKELRQIRRIARRLLLQLEKRGSDSSGIALVNKDYVRVLKQPVKAKQFVKTGQFRLMLRRLSGHTTGILLHTRAATKGSRDNNDNNHPIIADDIVGVHNGMIFNDDEVFRNFRQHFSRKAEVDSEAIFRLIHHYKRSSFMDIKSIGKALRKLYGCMGIAFVDAVNPACFYIYTNSSFTPVTLAWLPQLRVFVFASMKEYIKRSISHLKARRHCSYHALEDNELLRITTDKEKPESYRAKTKERNYGFRDRTGSLWMPDYAYLLSRGTLYDMLYDYEVNEKDSQEGKEGKEEQVDLFSFC